MKPTLTIQQVTPKIFIVNHRYRCESDTYIREDLGYARPDWPQLLRAAMAEVERRKQMA